MNFFSAKELVAGGALTVGFMADSDAGIFAGALVGSVFFVLTDKSFSREIKWALFVVSFAVGVITAGFGASLGTALTPSSVEVHRPMGALIASAIGVKILLGLPDKIIDSIDKGIKQVIQVVLNKLSRKGGGNDS